MPLRHKFTLHEKLDHMFFLMWRRNEKMKQRIYNIMTAFDDLTREVQETNDAIMAKLAEMQAQIDIIQSNPADVAVVTAAAAALDAMQKGALALVTPPADVPPVDVPPVV